MMVYEVENRSKRAFLIGINDHVKGGTVKLGADQKPSSISIDPGATVQVIEKCGKKLSEEWPGEIKVIRKVNRKE